MTGVEADAQARVAVERVAESGELRDRAADRATRAGGVLEAEPELVGRQLEKVAKRRCHLPDRVAEAVAEVRADVEDDRVGLDRSRRLHRRLQRLERLLPNRPVAAREVHEVEGMTRDVPDARLPPARPEALELLRRVLGRASTYAGSG